MIYEISRKQVTDTANWQTGYIKLSKPENDTSNSWERKNVTQLSKTADESYQEVLDFPNTTIKDKLSIIKQPVN